MATVFTSALPRKIKAGHYYVGPDYPGCINSGAAPTIVKSNSALKYCGKAFIVSGEFCIRFSFQESLINAIHGKTSEDMRRFGWKMYKTYAAARKDYQRRCAKIMEEYERAELAARRANDKTLTFEERLAAALVVRDGG